MFNIKEEQFRNDMLKALMGENTQYDGDVTAYVVEGEGTYVKLVSYDKDITGKLSNPMTSKMFKFKLPKRIRL